MPSNCVPQNDRERRSGRSARWTYERRDVSETCVGELSQVQLDGGQAARLWQVKEPNADRRSCASWSSRPESLPSSLWGASQPESGADLVCRSAPCRVSRDRQRQTKLDASLVGPEP